MSLRLDERGSGALCRSVLEELEPWFGIPEAVDDYVRTAEVTPTVVAGIEGNDVGLATIVTHSPYAAEVFVMAVRPAHHRSGVGSAMLRFAEEWLGPQGIEFLQVKTLSPRKADESYARTRAFYLAYGFKPLEEFPLLWGVENPALQLVKVVA